MAARVHRPGLAFGWQGKGVLHSSAEAQSMLGVRVMGSWLWARVTVGVGLAPGAGLGLGLFLGTCGLF